MDWRLAMLFRLLPRILSLILILCGLYIWWRSIPEHSGAETAFFLLFIGFYFDIEQDIKELKDKK